jgi:hypothetical protein
MGGQRHAPAALPSGKRPGTHCIGGWVGPRPGLDGCGKSHPNGIRSSDRPARSELLFRLSYPGPFLKLHTENIKRSEIWTIMWPWKTKLNGPALSKFLTSIFTFPPTDSATFPHLPFLHSMDWFSFFQIRVQMLETWTTFYLRPWMNYVLHCTNFHCETPIDIVWRSASTDFEPSRSRDMRKQWSEVHSQPYVKHDSYWAPKFFDNFLQRRPSFIKTPKTVLPLVIDQWRTDARMYVIPT